MIELIHFINKFQQLDSETENAVKMHFIEETYEKDEYLVEKGKVCSKVFFIKSGFVRRFFIKDEQEVTIWFYVSNQMTTSMPSFFEQKPAYEYLQASEDTVVFSLSFHDEQKLLDEYSLFAKFHLKQLRYYLAGLDEVNYRLKIMTAKEKYMMILALAPEIIQKAKLKHIASFLDVSQETLSRIRALIT
jgi:CRP-like cAMP-binding protein